MTGPSVIIVGHGPSILGEEMGMLIDEYDIVVRLKRCEETLKDPTHFGTKTDIVGGSMTIAGYLRDIPSPAYWIFLDSRHETVSPDALEAAKRLLSRNGAEVKADKEMCDYWDRLYRNMRTALEPHKQMKPSRYGDELGEKHLSQGMKAILYACQYLRPSKITLVGFDNIMTGEFTWSVTRGPDWQDYPVHRWDVEHQMLPSISNAFSVPIGYLLPEMEQAHD